ncbi:isopentenyl-diphosphate Delta-isomerase [Woeseia oceani]|uniref:Isopentenyl-diphosphate Delta-isomerase n=1 Tax=Woeseia oceani TaxID=1548547 RepID=A0A193LCT9_9GAMM|nr:isopentenyl-diphosphate Delta-isomerase [Woeseia oceani]ANO50204.1 isopentenyl-diphosphate delta-isomerase [Woeseia oceani]
MSSANAHAIVSSDSEELILVNEHDEETGSLSKLACHDGDGLLHRAFSVFLFNQKGELLVQQRAAGKRLWPGFWANSCCSHPRKGESMEIATQRRLQQELGVSAQVEYVYKFRYQAVYRDLGAEHELCWVYLGRCAGPPQPNSTEIAAVRYLSPAAIDAELANNADSLTPWFKLEWERLSTEFAAQLARYTSAL